MEYAVTSTPDNLIRVSGLNNNTIEDEYVNSNVNILSLATINKDDEYYESNEENAKDNYENINKQDNLDNQSFSEVEGSFLKEDDDENEVPNSNSKAFSRASQHADENAKEQLIQQTDKFYKANKNKLVRSATVIRNEITDEFSLSNSEALNIILRFSRKQKNKLDEMLPRVDLDDFRSNVITTKKLNKENERLSRLLDSKNLSNHQVEGKKAQVVRSMSNIEDYKNFFDEDENLILDNTSGKYNLDAKRDLVLKKLNLKTEKIVFKKKIVNTMYNKSLENQRKSKRYLLNSLEKYIIKSQNLKYDPNATSNSFNKHVDQATGALSNENIDTSKKLSDYLHQKLSIISNNSLMPSGKNQNDLDFNLDKTLSNQNNQIQNKKKYQVIKEKIAEKSQFDFSRKARNEYFPYKIATNPHNTCLEVFRPRYGSALENPFNQANITDRYKYKTANNALHQNSYNRNRNLNLRDSNQNNISSSTILLSSEILSSSILTFENNKLKFKKNSFNNFINNMNPSNVMTNPYFRNYSTNANNINNLNLDYLKQIPINMDSLIKNNSGNRILESRCMSSLWRNYHK